MQFLVMKSDFQVWWAKFKKNGSYSLRDEDIAWFAWAASKASAQQTLNAPAHTDSTPQICPQCGSDDTGYRCCSCGTEWGADDD